MPREMKIACPFTYDEASEASKMQAPRSSSSWPQRQAGGRLPIQAARPGPVRGHALGQVGHPTLGGSVAGDGLARAIFDHDFDRPDLGFESITRRAHRAHIGRIKGKRAHLVTGSLQRCGCCVKLGLGAPVQHRFGAGFGQTVGQRETDLLRRPGHQGGVPGKIEQLDRRGKSSHPDRRPAPGGVQAGGSAAAWKWP